MEWLRRLAEDDKGLTLIELLAALALISIVALGLISVFWTGVSVWGREEIQSEAQYDARLALNKISSDIRECKNLGGLNQDAFSIRDKNGQPVPEGSEVTADLMPMQLYLEKTEVIDGVKTDCTILYLVNSYGQLCRQCRIFGTGKFKSSSTITVNQVNTSFSQEDGAILIKVIIVDEEGKQVFELLRTCKPRMGWRY